jgi:hypothetical protein
MGAAPGGWNIPTSISHSSFRTLDHPSQSQSSPPRLHDSDAVTTLLPITNPSPLQFLQVPNTVEQQRELTTEIAILRRQAAALNAPDTFAQCAKAERRAIALEKEADRLREQQEIAKNSFIVKFPRRLRTFTTFLVILNVIFNRPAVATLPPKAIWPFGKWLAMSSPSFTTATTNLVVGGLSPAAIKDVALWVGMLPWYMLTKRASEALLGRLY